MLRFKAQIAYDGTRFEGFQKQANGHRTIQAEIEKGLQFVLKKPTPIIGAGRTDSGVHATGQIISFLADWKHPAAALRDALNANLSDEIVILTIEQVHAEFHPRYDAKMRGYSYLVYNAPIRHPLYRHKSWHVKKPLDLSLMNQAASLLLGEHDFATFGQPPQGDKTIRHIFKAEWSTKAPFLQFEIKANAFLYRMVRSIVGSLRLVGEGTWSVEHFAYALEQRERKYCGQVAPPQGVYLVSVEYQ